MQRAQGRFERKPQLSILDELILTVLSQATSDTNRDRAFAGLKTRFDNWDEVLDARTSEVADAIRPGGIADVKSKRIQKILAEIKGREGSLDLTRLNELTDHEVTEYLCALPGVGPKTAACVLVFSMGRDAFPIDTHVYRVAVRLGLLEAKTSAERAHGVLSPAIPPELRYEFHMQLIEHGRTICKPRQPLCTACALLELCEAGPGFLTGQAR